MAKVPKQPRLPNPPATDPGSYQRLLHLAILKSMSDFAEAINQVSGGYADGYVFARPTIPPAGDLAPDRFCLKTNREIQGTAGSRYVIQGWSAVRESSISLSLTWVEFRTLTGT